MDLYDAASYHSLVLNTEGRSQRTQTLYLVYERRFLEFLKVRKIKADLDALNPLNVRQAALWCQGRSSGKRDGRKAVQMFLDVMKIWANFLEREGVWEVSPLRKVKRMAVPEHEVRPYARLEVAGLLAACDMPAPRARPWAARDRALIYLLLDTGIRVGEAATLTLDALQLTERRITVMGKGAKERSIGFGDVRAQDGGPGVRAVRAYLREREDRLARVRRDEPRLFLSTQLRPLTVAGLEKIVRRLGAVAGVEGAHPHRFRHTFATWYLGAYPGDEIGLRRVLGHASDRVLRQYVHLSQELVRDRAGRAAPSTQWLRSG